MQRQSLEEEHAVVEVVRVLYNRILPYHKHPGGLLEDEISTATVLLIPKLVAAASHDALSKMDFLPLTPEHVPMSAFEYPYAPTSFFRHDPPPVVE